MTNIKKQTIKEVLKDIETKVGYITPHAFVDYARAKSSPIHDLFEWDDDKAAELYRLQQARWYIREVEVEVMGKPMQKYWNATVDINDVPTQGYFSVEKVSSNKQLYKQVLIMALKELKHWEEKYKQIEDLKNVINVRVVKKAQRRYESL